MSVPNDYQNVFLKYSDIAGVMPLPSELNIAELAINTADGIIFAKTNTGQVLSFKDSSTFALAVHGHSISDIAELQTALDNLSTAASTAQNAADASLKKDQNLADLTDVALSRSNLGVMSAIETTTAIGTARGEAETYADTAITSLVGGASAAYNTLKALQTALETEDSAVSALVGTIGGVETRVATLEGQNLDSRITTAQQAAQTAQDSANASLKASDNLAAVADKAAARFNLDVYSKLEFSQGLSEVQGWAGGAQSAAGEAISRVAALEAQNLDSRISTAQSAANAAQSAANAAQSAAGSAESSAQNAQHAASDAVSRLVTLEGQNLDYRITGLDNRVSATEGVANSALKSSNNLSDLSDKSASRTNLEVYSKTEVDSATAAGYDALSRVQTIEAQNFGGQIATVQTAASDAYNIASGAASTASGFEYRLGMVESAAGSAGLAANNAANTGQQALDAVSSLSTSLGTMSTQNANSVSISGGTITGATVGTLGATLPEDAGMILTSRSTIRGGTFTGQP